MELPAQITIEDNGVFVLGTVNTIQQQLNGTGSVKVNDYATPSPAKTRQFLDCQPDRQVFNSPNTLVPCRDAKQIEKSSSSI